MIILFLLSFKYVVNSTLQVLQFPCYEDSFALAARFGFHDEHDRRVRIGLLLGHEACSDLIVPFFVLARVVFLELVVVRWVQPRVREEVILIAELLAESSQMNP